MITQDKSGLWRVQIDCSVYWFSSLTEAYLYLLGR
jgi:hypothetical protein